MPTETVPGRRPRTAVRRIALATMLALAAGGALAQSSPWYLIGSASVSHDDNLLRLSDGTPTPLGLSREDTTTSTALIGGFDRVIGRQRLAADLTLRDTRYAKNERYDNQSWSGSARLDWETAGRLSGRINGSTQRNLSDFNTDQFGLLSERNYEKVESLGAVLAWGRGSNWRVEGSAGVQRRRNSLDVPLVQARNVDQDSLGLGLVWRGSDRLEMRLGVQEARISFPTFRQTDTGYDSDTYDQQVVEASVRWRVGGTTWLDLRLSSDEVSYGDGDLRNNDSVNGSIGLDWRPTGKLRLALRATQDREMDGYPSAVRLLPPPFPPVPVIIASQRDRRSLTATLEWQATAKTFVGLTLLHAQRDLTQRTLSTASGTLFGEIVEPARTDVVRLEGRWNPRRWVQVGCDVRVETRRSPGPLTGNLEANRFGCYAQLMLQ